MIAEIIPEKRTGIDMESYSYLVPENIEADIRVGSIVDIPFGKKEMRGVVANLQLTTYNLQRDYELKEIKKVYSLPPIPSQYLNIVKWIASYYLCSSGEAMGLFLPPRITRPRNSAASSSQLVAGESCKLTTEQQEILDKLVDRLSIKGKKPALLFGVTGSGKTEIYIKLVEECIKLGKQAIILVPEIMPTPQVVEKFEQTFPDQVALYHSQLSQSERFVSYMQFRNGDKSVLIGPRSALLVPSENLGLIIIDEEQEDAYKQEKDPRYHAVTLAEKIASETTAFLLLGSATPRIETYHKAKSGQYDLFELKSRFGKMTLPTATVIDLKNELRRDNYSPISECLRQNIEDVLKNKRQVILFLNRRGISTFVSCRECGYVANCKKCEIPMVYHVFGNNHYLNCHHCDATAPVPATCPDCGSSKIKFFGAGMDKIESEIRKLFPKAKIRKIDSKSLENKGEYEKLHDDIRAKKIDILIGTQILAKGLDIDSVDLVGVISADVGLHLPYFRAAEKTFQIITQVSGRSGRKHNAGKTIIQTYWPESTAIRLASIHDYKGFYDSEITERVTHAYPPFVHLMRVVAEDQNPSKAKKTISEIAEQLKEAKIDFIGPGKCFLYRINNKFRYHIIIKTNNLPNNKITTILRSNPYITWDVDPVDLL